MKVLKKGSVCVFIFLIFSFFVSAEQKDEIVELFQTNPIKRGVRIDISNQIKSIIKFEGGNQLTALSAIESYGFKCYPQKNNSDIFYCVLRQKNTPLFYTREMVLKLIFKNKLLSDFSGEIIATYL